MKIFLEKLIVKHLFSGLAIISVAWLINAYIFALLGFYLAATWFLNINSPESIVYFASSIAHIAGSCFFFAIGGWLFKIKKDEIERRRINKSYEI